MAEKIVARLATKALGGDGRWVMRGTVPVPPGTFPSMAGTMPLAIVDHDGTVLPTQIEVASMYPREHDGADVVELLAQVGAPSGTAAGAELMYDVAAVSMPATSEGPAYTESVTRLLSSPGAIQVVGSDCFGHVYRADAWVPGRAPFIGGEARIERNGIAARSVRSYRVMTSEVGTQIGAPEGALSHFFGVHSYVTVWAEDDVVTIDLRINNGPSNHDKVDARDDILGDVYFAGLELWVPSQWTVVQQGPDPSFGQMRAVDAWTAVSLVAPLAGGKMHFMPSQGQFHRRLAICKVGAEAKAQRYLENRTMAFCVDGTGSDGKRLWSWWNPATARYFPQRYALPSLAHVTPAVKKKSIDDQLVPMLTALKTGKRWEKGPIATDRLGYAHPWGAPYGGVTGGGEIWMFDGIVAAETQSQDGYTLAELTHRVYQDRQPDVLFNLSGDATCVEDWLKSSPGGLHTGMNFYEYLKPGPDPFGFGEQETFQREYVQANGLAPDYEAALRGYQAIDQQHMIRAMRSAKVLAWLGNDPLAKDDLRMRAELFRLGFHQYNNASNGTYATAGLKGLWEYAKANPGKGHNVGRATGWGVDSALCAYAFGSTAYRAKMLGWFQVLVEAIALGQFPCNGFVMSKASAKGLGGKYNVRQQYEHAILENSWRGVVETVMRSVDAERMGKMQSVIAKATTAMASPMAWSPDLHGPWAQLAVSSLDDTIEYCGLPLPEGGHSNGVDKTQCWSSFAYGFAVTQSPTLLSRAAEMSGGDLKTQLQKMGLNNLGNTAALLALTQQG